MKHVILGLMVVLWSSAVLGHGIGVFADSAGTDCNLVIPYPGGAATAYVVGTVDSDGPTCVGSCSFKIQGLPEGWSASVSALGSTVSSVTGNVFGDGIRMFFPDSCYIPTRILLVLSITPSSAVEGATVAIAPHTDPAMRLCGWDSPSCGEPCPLFCVYDWFGYDCLCANHRLTTINGPPCVTHTPHSTWGEVKSIYR